jgi:hypothetical protein
MTAGARTSQPPLPDAAASGAPPRPACELASARTARHPATPAERGRAGVLLVQRCRWQLDATVIRHA